MQAIREIRQIERRYAGSNVTRIYIAFRPTKRGGARIDTYAVKTRRRKTGELAIKKVMVQYTDRRRYKVRDVIFNWFFHNYSVNWSYERLGARHPYCGVDEHAGEWGSCIREWGRNVRLRGTYLNGLEGTRYQYSGWKPGLGIEPLDFAECHDMDSRVEYLAKAGCARLIRPHFVRRLARDRRLLAFLRERLLSKGEMPAREWTVSAVNRAFKTGESFAVAADMMSTLRELARCKTLPGDFPKEAVAGWCLKNGVDGLSYCEYANYVKDCGEDITAFGVTMPRDFRAAIAEYERKASKASGRRPPRCREPSIASSRKSQGGLPDYAI